MAQGQSDYSLSGHYVVVFEIDFYLLEANFSSGKNHHINNTKSNALGLAKH